MKDHEQRGLRPLVVTALLLAATAAIPAQAPSQSTPNPIPAPSAIGTIWPFPAHLTGSPIG